MWTPETPYTFCCQASIRGFLFMEYNMVFEDEDMVALKLKNKFEDEDMETIDAALDYCVGVKRLDSIVTRLLFAKVRKMKGE